jgi:hypothetical protein
MLEGLAIDAAKAYAVVQLATPAALDQIARVKTLASRTWYRVLASVSFVNALLLWEFAIQSSVRLPMVFGSVAVATLASGLVFRDVFVHHRSLSICYLLAFILQPILTIVAVLIGLHFITLLLLGLMGFLLLAVLTRMLATTA